MPLFRQPAPSDPDRNGPPLRIALLSYRSKPHCGGQGIYVRHLSRELTALGHTVEVFSGQPYPDLDEGVGLTKVPSLDLYREPDPFRTPRPSEIRDLLDVEEVLTMWTAGFPEPKTFSKRAARLLRGRRDDFDIVHDNQVLGYGMLDLKDMGFPLITSIHHPITFDRRIDLAAATRPWHQLTLRRWYGFLRMQAKVAREGRGDPDRLGVQPPRHRQGLRRRRRADRGDPAGCGRGVRARRPRRGCRAGSSRWPARTRR